MADAARQNAAQRAHESNHLTYGHFGTSTYDTERQEWTFLRQSLPQANEDSERPDTREHDDSTSLFERLQEPVQVLSQALPASSTSQLHSTSNVNSSLKFLPQAATGLADYKTSLTVHGTHDAVPGNETNPSQDRLFVFGQASVRGGDEAEQRLLAVPILAHVSSWDGLQLRLACLGRMSFLGKTGDLLNHKIETPCISTEETGIWKSAHGLIHQVMSVGGIGGHAQSTIAVRSALATTLLHPLLRGTAFARSSSVLNADTVLTIPCTSTGGVPHADVCFQPQKAEQLAIIDTAGNWSIWRLRGRRSTARVRYRARLLASASLYAEYQSTKNSKSLKYLDGWHKICWITTTNESADRILVCNRYFAYLYDTRGKTKEEVDTRIKLGTRRDSILDMKSLASSTQEVFFLTTSRLLWMTIGKSNDKHGRQESDLTLLVSWNHFRGHSDANLCMHLLDHTNGVFVLLSTSASPMLTIYHASRLMSQSFTKYTISDPMPIEPLSSSVGEATQPRVEAVEWVESLDADRTSHKLLFKIFFSDSFGNIHEAVYRIRGLDSVSFEVEPLQVIALPPKHLKISRSERYVDAEGLEDFLIGDESPERSVESVPLQAKEAEKEDGTVHHDARVHDLHATYSGLLDAMQSYMTGDKTNLRQYLQQVKHNLMSIQSLHLLSELYSDRPYVAEIEDDSEQLATLLKQFVPDSTEGTLLSNATSLELMTIDSRSLVEIYQDIVENWMSILPPTIPDRTRIYQERLFRQIALDLYLASLAIHEKIEQEPQFSQNTTADLNTQVPSSPPIPLTQSSLLLPSSQAGTSSQLLPSSQVPPANKPSTSILSKYTTINPSTLPPLTPELTNILSHLPPTINTSPSTYDYNTVEHNLSTQLSNLTTQSLSLRARRKAEKTARAQKLRMEKQQALKNVVLEQNTLLPSVVSSQMPIREVKSSQIVPTGGSSQSGSGDVGQVSHDPVGITLTQPERGVHGVRSGKKGKGKGKSIRIPGFS